MKKATLFITCFLLLTNMLFSQNQTDKMLIDYLGKERFDFLTERHPKQIQYQTYRLQHSYKVLPVKEAKAKISADKMEVIEQITFQPKNGEAQTLSSEEVKKAIESGTFNVLTSNLRPYKNTDRYLWLKGTDSVILLYSEEKIVQNYANSLK